MHVLERGRAVAVQSPTLTEIKDRAFAGCTSVSEITLRPNLTEIGKGAFRECTSLSEIALPPTLTKIRGQAFFGCSSLAEITLRPLLAIEKGAFDGCSSLTGITTPLFRHVAMGSENATLRSRVAVLEAWQLILAGLCAVVNRSLT